MSELAWVAEIGKREITKTQNWKIKPENEKRKINTENTKMPEKKMWLIALRKERKLLVNLPFCCWTELLFIQRPPASMDPHQPEELSQPGSKRQLFGLQSRYRGWGL